MELKFLYCYMDLRIYRTRIPEATKYFSFIPTHRSLMTIPHICLAAKYNLIFCMLQTILPIPTKNSHFPPRLSRCNHACKVNCNIIPLDLFHPIPFRGICLQTPTHAPKQIIGTLFFSLNMRASY